MTLQIQTTILILLYWCVDRGFHLVLWIPMYESSTLWALSIHDLFLYECMYAWAWIHVSNFHLINCPCHHPHNERPFLVVMIIWLEKVECFKYSMQQLSMMMWDGYIVKFHHLCIHWWSFALCLVIEIMFFAWVWVNFQAH